MLASDHERVRTFAGQLLTADGSEESRNVISNITKYTVAWAEGGPLATVCRTSDFDVETFAMRPQSLFIVAPQEKLRFYKPFLQGGRGRSARGFGTVWPGVSGRWPEAIVPA